MSEEQRVAISELRHLPELVFQFARASIGPIRSGVYFAAVHLPGLRQLAIRRQPHTENFLYHKKDPEQTPLGQCAEVLTAIDERLYNQGQPEHYIGQELFGQYQQIRDQLQAEVVQQLGKPGNLSDYVFFDRETRQNILFFQTEDNSLIPIVINQAFDAKSLQFKEAIENEMPASYLDEELRLDEVLREMGFAEWSTDTQAYSLRRVTSICNEFHLTRQADLEHDGILINNLRDKGVHTIGELQAVFRLLFSKGIQAGQDGKTYVDKDLLVRARKIFCLAYPEIAQEHAEQWICEAAQERLYFHTITKKIRQNTALVLAFMQSRAFSQHAQAFKDRHLASLGQTERETAIAMLAGLYVLHYEGNPPDQSRSQYYLAKEVSYFEDIEQFLADYSNAGGITPELIDSESKQEQEVVCGVIETTEPFDQQKQEVIDKFDASYFGVRCQMRRHRTHQALLGTLQKVRVPITVDPRKGMFPNLIANLAIKRVKTDEGRYHLLSSTWLWQNGGYLLEDGEIPPDFNEQKSKVNPETDELEPVSTRLDRSLQYIFGIDQEQGAVESGSVYDKYQAQEQRIISEAPTIMEYLATDEAVPASIRDFINQIISGEFVTRVLEKFGSISDQDPNIIGRFFPEGLQAFTQSVSYRYAFDFVRGVETNLGLQNGFLARIRAQFVGDWKPLDAAKLSLEKLTIAKQRTLQDGEHRLAWMNHETSKIKTLKDLQEKAEIIFGWDTDDMKFLRWVPFWDVWNTLGGAWDCVCFTRKTIFNPRAFKAA